MIYNTINDLTPSIMGIGIMRHDANDFNTTQNIIDLCMKNGINYFESCYFYLNNNCEKILAKALKKYPRDSYILCGKMPVHGVLERKSIEDVFSEQLKNCNTNYFDVYLLQALDRNCFDILKKQNAIEFLNKKREQGIIKNFGFSFHDTPEILEKYISMNNWDCIQLQLNYYDWYISMGKELYSICSKYNLPIIVMGGVKGGTICENLPEEAKKILKNLNPNIPIVYWAYKFLTTLSNVKIILSGANNIEQIQQNIDFFNDKNNFGLCKYEIEYIKKVIELYKEQNYIGCTSCGYCMSECPQRINIKDVFNLYNNILKNKDDKNSRDLYLKILKSDNSPLDCRGCGKCSKKCPQHLDISSFMHKQIFALRA